MLQGRVARALLLYSGAWCVLSGSVPLQTGSSRTAPANHRRIGSTCPQVRGSRPGRSYSRLQCIPMANRYMVVSDRGRSALRADRTQGDPARAARAVARDRDLSRYFPPTAARDTPLSRPRCPVARGHGREQSIASASGCSCHRLGGCVTDKEDGTDAPAPCVNFEEKACRRW